MKTFALKKKDKDNVKRAPALAIQAFLLGIFSFNNAQALSLPLQSIISYECKHCHALSHEAINFAWPIEPNALFEEITHENISRKYVISTSFYALQSGNLVIQTQAPGAIIRITSLNRKLKLPKTLQIKNAQSQTFTLQDASSVISDSTDLKDTAFASYKGQTVGFQLKEEVGAGMITLNLPPEFATTQQISKKNSLLVHVYDKNASTFLCLQTDKARYGFGQKVYVNLNLQDKTINYPINQAQAFLIHPDGKKTALKLKSQSNNIYQAVIKLDSREIEAPGKNFEIIVDTSTFINGQEIKRQAHTLLSYAIPSASLQSINRYGLNAFSFIGQLKVATASRYAIEAILYARDAKHRRIPVQRVQSAAWLEPGDRNIYFVFDQPMKKTYQPPYELGALRLMDFNQLKPIYEYSLPIDLTNLP